MAIVGFGKRTERSNQTIRHKDATFLHYKNQKASKTVPIFKLHFRKPYQMDSNNLNTHENPDSNTTESQNPLPIVASNSPFATASLSLSLSTLLPSQLFYKPKISAIFSHQLSRVKVPSQASSLSHLSLSSSSINPPKMSFKSTISANPLLTPLSLGPRSPLDPSNAAGIRRASIVWFRNDLRTHDNECLNSAHNESMSVLPVYCFDPRDYGKSSSGFDRTSPYRTSFLIESVSDLRKNLQARGSDLVVRIGKPETVLAELAKAVGADAVYAHREVTGNEIKTEERIEAAMKEEGVEMKYFWGSTLYHIDDLPFKLEDMPTNYGGFKEKVKGLEVRKTIAASDQLKGKPARGDVEAGDIPSLMDLGLNPPATLPQDGLSAAYTSMVGGETEGLQKLKKIAAEYQAQPHKCGSNGSTYGANFSSKVSPWLTMGCISPRSMFDELKKTASRNDSGNGSSNTGTNWLMHELLWRDFFRNITKKYSSGRKQLNTAPATASTCANA